MRILQQPDSPAAPAALSQGLERGAVSPEELARLFEEFSSATQKMQESHRALELRVAELHSELAEKNLLLERKKRLEALGLMVAGVAHEIRNPLGSISLYLDCLAQELAGSSTEASAGRFVEQIDEAITHLNSIVENMLVFTASADSCREDCDALALVQEARELLRGDIEKTETDVSIEAEAGEAPALSGDPDQVRCVVVNVIKNGIQAMGQGGKIQIRIAALSPDSAPGSYRTSVTLRDSGPGIPAENLEKVFVPFFTDGKKKGGVGLGLTIVHSLMEKQGGAIELRNHPEGGLEVTLLFT